MALAALNMAHVYNSDKEMTRSVDITVKTSSQNQALQETTSVLDVSIFGESKGLADVTLVVEDRKIPVTKAVLELASPVFLAMFQSDFQEMEKSEIPLPDKKLPAFVKFLKCIYPNILEKVTEENVYEVVYLANEYQVEHLKTSCEPVLLKGLIKLEDPISLDSCIKVYQHLAIAETCRFDELQARCIGIASGLTKADREAAAKVHPVSKKIEMIVDNQAIRKLEINTSDLQKLLRCVGGDDLQDVKNYIYGKQNIKPQVEQPGATRRPLRPPPLKQAFCFGPPPSIPIRSILRVDPDSAEWAENLQKIRWMYQYDEKSENLKKEAIEKVRKDRLKRGWETTCKKEFDLLPEKIKHDIRGRKVMKN